MYLLFKNVPFFGEYQKLREKVEAEVNLRSNLLDKNFEVYRPAPQPIQKIPTVNEIVGKALPHIKNYKQLDNKQQVVALIDDVRNIKTKNKIQCLNKILRSSIDI